MLAEYPDAESKYQGWKEWRSGQFYGHLVFLQLDELQCHSHKGCSCLEALTGLLHKVRCTLRWSQETFRNERTRMKLFLQALPPEEALLSPLNPNHLQILCRCRAENFKFQNTYSSNDNISFLFSSITKVKGEREKRKKHTHPHIPTQSPETKQKMSGESLKTKLDLDKGNKQQIRLLQKVTRINGGELRWKLRVMQIVYITRVLWEWGELRQAFSIAQIVRVPQEHTTQKLDRLFRFRPIILIDMTPVFETQRSPKYLGLLIRLAA